MVQYIITPWRDADELLLVRGQLYPDPNSNPHHGMSREIKEEKRGEEEERKRAIALVSVWMQRGNCPHLAESTAILTAAVLNDVPGNSAYCVRAAYSAAFCRFVTGLLDSHQDKRRKLSMYHIAKTIGLPATYVELRHQATHEELPSLSKLRTATQKALRWIWDYYWFRLPPAAPRTDDCKTFVHGLLQEGGDAFQDQTLESWDQDELLATLMEIQGSTEDVAILLRATQLYQRIMSLSPRSGRSEIGHGDVEPVVTDLERVKQELSRMEHDLDDSDDAPLEKSTSLTDSSAPIVKGWTLWEGPWIPKPIGVV